MRDGTGRARESQGLGGGGLRSGSGLPYGAPRSHGPYETGEHALVFF